MSALSNNRYIEFDSTYRDRSQYPNPADFTIMSEQTEYNNRDASDPVSLAAMIYPRPYQTNPVTFENYNYLFQPLIPMAPLGNIVGIIPSFINNSGHFNSNISADIVNNDQINLLNVCKIYSGSLLEIISTTVGAVLTPVNEFETIVKSYLKDVTVVTGTIGTVVAAPTTTSFEIVSTNPANITNFYVGMTVTINPDTSTAIERTITYHRAEDNRIFFDDAILPAPTAGAVIKIVYPKAIILELANPLSITPQPLSAIDKDNFTTFRLRKQYAPIEQGTLQAATTSSFTLPASTSLLDYTGKYIWLKTNPVVYSSSFGVIGAANEFTFNTATTFADNFFRNYYIVSAEFDGPYYITSFDSATQTGTIYGTWTGDATVPTQTSLFTIYSYYPAALYRKITSYNVTTRVGTINGVFSYPNFNNQEIMFAPDNTYQYDILTINQDLANSFNYIGSRTNQNQPTCYNVRMTSLILPNEALNAAQGGTILNYPYVYVQLIPHSGIGQHPIFSNNPHSVQCLFKVPIVNFYDPYTRFIDLVSADMSPLIKIKPTDSFTFRVLLPDGTLFQTRADNSPPTYPDSYLQISAIFEFTQNFKETTN
jgi:hypothetical protein